MKLKPFEPNSIEVTADEVLAELIPGSGATKHVPEKVSDIFTRAGASLSEAARNIAYLMGNAEKDETKLRASELALRVQGALKDDTNKHIPEIIINVIGSGNNTLINLVTPGVI